MVNRGTRARRPPATAEALLAALLLLLATACASVPAPPETIEQAIRARGLDPRQIVDPTATTPEMKAWARAHDDPRRTDEERLQALLAALLADQELDLRYRRDHTGTAVEVFTTGEANCLSFTNLFVGMAREVGLPVHYTTIRRPPSFEREGDLVVVWEHVTAGFDSGRERMVLEFRLAPIERYVPGERLSDLTARAMFHSNRGAELLLAGRAHEALSWLETAVRLDPGWSNGWLNLGVARRRLGDLAGAEAAYRRGIDADADDLQLYGNLAALLRQRGEPDAAGELLELLDHRRSRNPYLYLSLGDAALREGRLEDARRFYRRALRRGGESAETRAAMGLWELAAGRVERARRSLRRAEDLDSDAAHVQRLRARLANGDDERSASGQSGGPLQLRLDHRDSNSRSRP